MRCHLRGKDREQQKTRTSTRFCQVSRRWDVHNSRRPPMCNKPTFNVFKEVVEEGIYCPVMSVWGEHGSQTNKAKVTSGKGHVENLIIKWINLLDHLQRATKVLMTTETKTTWWNLKYAGMITNWPLLPADKYLSINVTLITQVGSSTSSLLTPAQNPAALHFLVALPTFRCRPIWQHV